MGLSAQPPKERWSTQQHRVSKEIHEFFKQQHPQSTGRVLAFTIMHQIRPHFPSPPPLASEADSCFMGRPFTHSRPGSPPRDTRASPTGWAQPPSLSFTFFPISHQRQWASWLLTKASSLTRHPAKHSLPCTNSAPRGGRGQRRASLKYLLQYLALSFRMKN